MSTSDQQEATPQGSAGVPVAVSGRIPQLDGVRGLAIILVLIWHYFSMLVYPAESQFLFHFKQLFNLTWSGVDLFFVLSGFLIAGILVDQKGATNYFRVFYLRRTCRIMPLYFLIFFLYIVLARVPVFKGEAYKWVFADPLPLWSYAAFVQNYFMGATGQFGPNWLAMTWSLAVEEQFYLFIPLLIYFLPKRAVLIVFAVLIALAPILRFLYPGFIAFVGMPWRGDSLLMGACLAILVRSPRFIKTVSAHYRWLLLVFAALVLGYVKLNSVALAFGVFNHTWLACLYTTLILMSLVRPEGLLARLLKTRVLVWFGTLSYGIYMFHQGINGIMHGMMRGNVPYIGTWSDAGVTIAALVITIFLAVLSHRFFEKPILAAGHRFKYRRES